MSLRSADSTFIAWPRGRCANFVNTALTSSPRRATTREESCDVLGIACLLRAGYGVGCAISGATAEPSESRFGCPPGWHRMGADLRNVAILVERNALLSQAVRSRQPSDVTMRKVI